MWCKRWPAQQGACWGAEACPAQAGTAATPEQLWAAPPRAAQRASLGGRHSPSPEQPFCARLFAHVLLDHDEPARLEPLPAAREEVQQVVCGRRQRRRIRVGGRRRGPVGPCRHVGGALACPPWCPNRCKQCNPPCQPLALQSHPPRTVSEVERAPLDPDDVVALRLELVLLQAPLVKVDGAVVRRAAQLARAAHQILLCAHVCARGRSACKHSMSASTARAQSQRVQAQRERVQAERSLKHARAAPPSHARVPPSWAVPSATRRFAPQSQRPRPTPPANAAPPHPLPAGGAPTAPAGPPPGTGAAAAPCSRAPRPRRSLHAHARTRGRRPPRGRSRAAPVLRGTRGPQAKVGGAHRELTERHERALARRRLCQLALEHLRLSMGTATPRQGEAWGTLH